MQDQRSFSHGAIKAGPARLDGLPSPTPGGFVMKVITDLRIGTRLSAGFAIVIALLVTLAVIGITRIDAVDDDTEVIVHDLFVKVKLAQDIETDLNRQLRAMRTALIVTEAAATRQALERLEASRAVVVKALERLSTTVHSERGKVALKELVDRRASFQELEQRMIDLVNAGKADEARSHLLTDFLPLQNAYLKAVETFSKSQADAIEEFGADAAELANSAKRWMGLLSATAVALALLIAVLLTRSITRPIDEALRVAETVAVGDLTSSIQPHSRDETGQLLTALGAMNASLLRIVNEVRLSSESIATGSHQIATGSADLSQRTEEQSSSLQQTAAAMEQLTETVRQSADAARSAAELASATSAVAIKGGRVVTEVVATMRGISASAHRIADITGVIDSIAFQTNILALNAAVEAARAGEHGRGFAVVASEVRMLAQRTATAAKEIKVLIGESVSRVEAGSQQVEGAGSTMSEIVQQVHKVAQLITEIGTASAQQSLGIGEVSKAVGELDQVTQQNAALVEESAAAAESLNEQARRLTEVVGAFKLRPPAAP